MSEAAIRNRRLSRDRGSYSDTRSSRRTVTGATIAGSITAYQRALLKRWRIRSWRRVKRGVRATARAITPLGWFVSAVAIAGIAAGSVFAWIEAWFVAVIAALLLIVAIPFLLGSRAYRTAMRLERKHTIAGGTVQLDVEVENAVARPQLPAVIELPVGDALRELSVPLLGSHQLATIPVTVAATRRGVILVGPLTVARQDPLGMLRREVTWRDVQQVHVHPNTVSLPPNSAGFVSDLEGWASHKLTDSDLSFHAVREYVPGDALRHVHWKSTAKTGTLMVRQYEETQTARFAVLFDARREEYASDDEFELGVSLAASVSVQAVREGRERFIASAWTPGRLRPRVDGLEELPSRNPVQVLNAWAELGHAIEGLPIEVLASTLAHAMRDLSVAVIVTGSRPDMDRLRRAAVAFSADVRVMVLRADWLAEPRAQRFERLTVATIGVLSDLPQLMMRGSQ